MWKGEKISKSHASGVVTLIFLVLFIQGVLFLFGGKDNFGGKDIIDRKDKNPEEDVNGSLKSITAKFREKNEKILGDPNVGDPNVEDPKGEELFDPNTIDKSGLVRLGLSLKQAQVVVNYRLKGGKFRTAEDFSKIYVISPKTYERLKGYISIDNSQKDNTITHFVSKDTGITRVAPDTIKYEKRALLHLNMADSTELVSLPGIGPYYARKIIQYRDRLGGFATKEQLLEIYGIDRERFDLFAERIEVDSNDVTKRDLNKATFEDLSRNPYIGGYVARAIIRFKEKNGSELIDLASLIMNNIIQKELHKILKYYFK